MKKSVEKKDISKKIILGRFGIFSIENKCFFRPFKKFGSVWSVELPFDLASLGVIVILCFIMITARYRLKFVRLANSQKHFSRWFQRAVNFPHFLLWKGWHICRRSSARSQYLLRACAGPKDIMRVKMM